MSWRETLGVTAKAVTHFTQNTQNTQKPAEVPNCADIAEYAYSDASKKDAKLLEDLAYACKGLNITPAELKEALAPDDVDDWREGVISRDTLATFARAYMQRRYMDSGELPPHYNERATCRHCGPVWLWFSATVMMCPWCWNRLAGRPIPRPISVRCRDCLYFQRIDHPNLGHCAKGEPEALAGLWDTDRRDCLRYLPAKALPP